VTGAGHTVWVSETLSDRLRNEIVDNGPMPFAGFVERALYDVDQGFYATSGRAGGRRGDFITSVEAGPLFAAVVGDWLDGVWRSLGEPADFAVSEVGAGVGTLFRGLNRSKPDCFEALTYTLVERSATMRQAHELLPTNNWRSADNLVGARQHVVLANELLDNLAFGIAERTDTGWAPVMVTADGPDLLLEATSTLSDLAYLSELAPAVSRGARVPVAAEAAAWVRRAQAMADHVLVFDYAASTIELAERGQTAWLRTYAGHERGSDPLAAIGHCDITHDVPLDQLPVPSAIFAQADWLRSQGIDARVHAARRVWAERSGIGDLEAMIARSAVGEAEALCDPTGLGGFMVLQWSN